VASANPSATASREAPADRMAMLITIRTILPSKGRMVRYDSPILTAWPRGTPETAYAVAPVAKERATRYTTATAMARAPNAAAAVVASTLGAGTELSTQKPAWARRKTAGGSADMPANSRKLFL